MLYSFNTNSFNSIYFNKYKKQINYSRSILFDYMKEFGDKLVKKHSKDKNFYKKFLSRKRSFKRFKNIYYFFRWKPKYLNFHFISFLKKSKSIRKLIFSAFLTKFLNKKIFWIKKKSSKSFLLFYYINFFFNKFFILFNLFFKAKFGFVKSKKWKKRKRLRRRRFTVYIKQIRRRIIRAKIKRKILKFFLILLFFKLMKKHKNASKFLILRNSLFLSKLKKIKTNLLSSILLGNDAFYFKNSVFVDFDVYNFKKNLKIITLLKKN